MDTTFPCIRLSDPGHPTVHAYYDCCPESPDGQRVACFRFDGPVPGVGRVEVRDRDGALLDSFGHGATGDGHVGAFPTWADDDAILWVDGPDGLSGEPRTFLRELSRDAQPELPGRIRQFHSASGRGLVQECARDEANPLGLTTAVAVIDRQGATIGRITREGCYATLPDPAAAPPASCLSLMNAKWSPDGSRFIAVYNTEPYRKLGGTDDVARFKTLVVAQADGSGLRFLGHFTHHPSWTPDGSGIIAFNRNADGDGQDLVRFDAESGEPTVLLADVPGVHPTIAPDHASVVTDVFDQTAGRARIVRYPLPEGEPELLADFAHVDFAHRDGHHPHPVFSRDGRRIYFNAQDGGACGLWALDLVE